MSGRRIWISGRGEGAEVLGQAEAPLPPGLKTGVMPGPPFGGG